MAKPPRRDRPSPNQGRASAALVAAMEAKLQGMADALAGVVAHTPPAFLPAVLDVLDHARASVFQRMAPGKSKARGAAVVHGLIARRAPCGLPGSPDAWPPRHKWTESYRQITCARCLVLASVGRDALLLSLERGATYRQIEEAMDEARAAAQNRKPAEGSKA